jgi:hypothetical protein
VGPTLRRTTASGFLNSAKMDLSNGGILDGWTSLRPEGGVLIVGSQNNPLNGTVRNVLSIFDSSVSTTNSASGSTGGLSFPNNCYNEVTAENARLIDV